MRCPNPALRGDLYVWLMAGAKDNLAGKGVVWVICDGQWERACLRAELLERGFQAIGHPGIAPALAALRHPNFASPDLIVVELRDLALRRDELTALARIDVPLIALGGAVELNHSFVKEVGWKSSLRRPFTVGQVVDLVETSLGGN